MLELLGLFLILDDKCVKEARAANLELGAVGVLLDFDALSILSPGFQEEILQKIPK